MKAEKFEFQSAFAGLSFAYVKSENRKRNFSSKMSSLYLNENATASCCIPVLFFPPCPHGLHTWLHNASSLATESKLQPCVLTCSSMVRRASQTMFELFLKRILQTGTSHFLDRLVGTYIKEWTLVAFLPAVFKNILSKNNGMKTPQFQHQ